MKVLAAREQACETSNSTALTQTLTQIRQALRVQQPVVLGLPSTSAILTTIQPLIANPRRASLAVQFELQQLLPFSLADASWHFQWLAGANGQALWTRGASTAREGGARGRTLRDRAGVSSPPLGPALVVAMRRSLLEERLACCRRAGLKVRTVSINAVAALNAWYATQSSPGAATVLLNIAGPQMIEWVIVTPSMVQVIPLASGLSEGLAQEVTTSWRALQSQFVELANVAVQAAGLPEGTARLRDILTEALGLPIGEFDPTLIVSGEWARITRSACSVAALGLALEGLRTPRFRINLVAEAQTQDRVRDIQRLAHLVSGLCALAAIGFGMGGMTESSRRRTTVLQLLERRERLYQTLRPEIRSLLQHQERVQRRNDALERLATQAPGVTQLISQIAGALPETVWLTKIECSRANALEGLLEGRAKSFQDVTRLIDRLKTAGMSAVKPLSTNVTAEEGTGKELIAFSVQVQARVQEPERGADASVQQEPGGKMRRTTRPDGRGGERGTQGAGSLAPH